MQRQCPAWCFYSALRLHYSDPLFAGGEILSKNGRKCYKYLYIYKCTSGTNCVIYIYITLYALYNRQMCITKLMIINRMFLPVVGSLEFFQTLWFSSFQESAALHIFFPQSIFLSQFLSKIKR